jgi:hypothetical protein
MKKSVISIGIAFLGFLMIAGTAYAEGKEISSDSYFGCTNRDYFEKLIGYAVEKDMGAFKQGLGAGMLAGQCTMFKAGEEVFIVDTAIFSGLVKVRRHGSMAEYWTNIEAVK